MSRILIIEDDAGLRGLYAWALRREGYAVIEAGTGKEGLKLLRTDAPYLVVTDLVMPEQDGIEVIMAIRKEMPGMPVIAMSGALASQLYLNAAKQLGARRILLKPFSFGGLALAVRELLEPTG